MPSIENFLHYANTVLPAQPTGAVRAICAFFGDNLIRREFRQTPQSDRQIALLRLTISHLGESAPTRSRYASAVEDVPGEGPGELAAFAGF